MPTDCISYQDSGYFSSLINDYLDEKPNLESFYNRFPKIENFEAQIQEKSKHFDSKTRETLVLALEQQYQNTATSTATKLNIAQLKANNSFTVTTGHQLNLFSGPLYFLYKIISTINLTKQLKAKYPQHNFVPIYWMATEDHDFEEINYFNFKGKKIRWNSPSTGPVGRLSTNSLAPLFELFAQELGNTTNAIFLKNLFEEAYLKHNNLTNATRYLANELFGQQGLVIIDGDDSSLKNLFAPYIKDELLAQKSFKEVTKTITKLSNYNIQVNPREINLFYIENTLRERIIFENKKFKVNNTELEFSETEILNLLNSQPEKFSPNVIMRPLYQEVILPNLCYIGGGGEIGYWLELKSFFEAAKVPFPMLLVRNSVLLTTQKQEQKADALGLSWADLFQKQAKLINSITQKASEFPIDLTVQKEQLQKQFDSLYALALQTDQSFTGAVKAQEKKQLKGLENLEKRLLKAQKRKYTDQIERATSLQDALFPNQSLQERQLNFSEFYLENGMQLIPKIIEKLQPLEQNFEIITF